MLLAEDGMEEVAGTAEVGMQDGMVVAGAVGVVAGAGAGGMAEVGGRDMATAGMVLVILIGDGTAAAGVEAGTAAAGVEAVGVVAGTVAVGMVVGAAVAGVSRRRLYRATRLQRWLALTDPGPNILKPARHRQESQLSGFDSYIWISLNGCTPRRKSCALRSGQLFGKY
ncbi:MAG TPA: hypothetical protein VF020_05340 [Chthoniobacterales bacterium]